MPDLAAYYEAVAYCESLLRPSIEASGEAGLRQRYCRMAYFLERLGNPQRRFAAVHVAGTSGKGSTTTMIGSILHAAGLKAGVHCTPYLQTPIERMQVGALYASPAEFAGLIDEIRPAILHMQQRSRFRDISYREIAVAQAFLYFAACGVDIAAIETGMGGRFDYTNYVSPLVSVIVTVDYDHVATLGPTLERIAYHKAGIIKEGVPVVSGATAAAAMHVIEREAARRHAALARLPGEIAIMIRSVGRDGSVFDFRSPWGEIEGLHVAMLGRHQVTNAALAAAAALLLARRGIEISETAIRDGLAGARMPGRLEIVQQEPVVVLDGAHNPEKMRALAAALSELFPGQRPVVVAGVLAAKDVRGTLAELAPVSLRIVVTSPLVRAKPAVAADVLAEECRSLGAAASAQPDLPAAIEQAIDMAGPRGLVCVTGSLYMVGQARELWTPSALILQQRTSFPSRSSLA